ncbi:MAG: UDP-N-acetylmuramoyl-tripeptide--D-alanyl-D-alanine ligase [Betaproteobacteria bacterium]
MMTLAEACRIMGGTLAPAHDERVFERVTIDSRGVRAGDLFVALKGERVDGHAFVDSALAAGAAGALVRADAAQQVRACLTVADPLLALGQLARAWRARFTLPLIAVVGSNGKTTVTQMIASILREHARERAFHTEGNLNNEIGLPLTLVRLRPLHTVGVVELGMNHRGEIAYLSGIARPTVALVNNAQREHQEFLQSVDDVAAENASVFDFLPHDGIAIVNADDAHAVYCRRRAGGRRVLSFGLDQPADIRGTAGGAAFGNHLEIQVGDGGEDARAEVPLRIAGRHNALNALAAAAAAIAVGVPLPTIARGLAAFTPVSGRLAKRMLANGAVVLDDSYNANPDSVRAAIDVLTGVAGRRVLVLGRMAEVGAQGPEFHREVGAYAKARGIDALLTLGPEAAEAATAFGGGAGPFADVQELIARAREVAAPGTTLLVKGSRSARMERVVRALLDEGDTRLEETH